MPKRRPPRTIWLELRKIVWIRCNGKCSRCGKELSLFRCHIDHIHSGKNATNKIRNLRVLCLECHTLRLDKRHRGLVGKGLQLGIIDENWRSKTWE